MKYAKTSARKRGRSPFSTLKGIRKVYLPHFRAKWNPWDNEELTFEALQKATLINFTSFWRLDEGVAAESGSYYFRSVTTPDNPGKY